MLVSLTIKNIALIEYAEIPFNKGLNVLSGETGAGKSVIIDSLNFVLGAKAEKSLIRNGETECLVSVEFDVSDENEIKNLFKEFDFEDEDTLLITRKFNLDGKTTIKINGNTATLSMLKKFSSVLVDVHGQSEHFYLLNENNQLKLIDTMCINDIFGIKETIKSDLSLYNEIKSKLKELGGNKTERDTKIDILSYQINEIEKAELKEGEEEELSEIRKKLINEEKISTSLNMLKDSINSEGGVNDILFNAEKVLYGISNLDIHYAELNERLNNVISEIEDIGETASNMIELFDVSEYNIETVEERIDVIKGLKKKYGNNYNEIIAFLENAKKEKQLLENYEETAKELLIKKEEIENKLYNSYIKLSEIRKKTAKNFSENIIKELKDLGMENAKFNVSFNTLTDKENCTFSLNGIDSVSFMFSANLGEEAKPLSEIISGGEMSRFMLAIKAQTAKLNTIGTFIFDEIDAGISGKIAKIVSYKFNKIAKDVQIIAITHLPQISVMADTNILIIKETKDNKTVTEVKILTEDEKVNEIIRLTGGDIKSEISKQHALELINEAKQYKANN